MLPEAMRGCYYCYSVCDLCRKKAEPIPSPNETKTFIEELVSTKVSRPSKSKKYGFISQASIDSGNGTVWYKRPDGSLVEVSWIAEDPDTTGSLWTDLICVGEVTDYVKKGILPYWEDTREPITQRY